VGLGIINRVPGNCTSSTDNEQQDADLDQGKSVVEQDAAPTGETVDKASDDSDGDGDAAYFARCEVFFWPSGMSSLQKPQGTYNAIPCHVPNADKADAEEAADQ
jgi:hypothetical protein